MIPEDTKHLDQRRMHIELLSSIKILDARLDELEVMARLSPYSSKNKALSKRIEHLTNTRLKLTYVVISLAEQRRVKEEILNPFREIDVSLDTIQSTRRLTEPMVSVKPRPLTRLKRLWAKITRRQK